MGEVSEQRRAQVQPGLDVALVYVQATIACLERVAEIYRQSAESERCSEGQLRHEQSNGDILPETRPF